jgi:hypothetical protein
MIPLSGCSETTRYKAPDIPMGEAYMRVRLNDTGGWQRSRWAFLSNPLLGSCRILLVADAFMLATDITDIGIGWFPDFPCLNDNKISSQGSPDDNENNQ